MGYKISKLEMPKNNLEWGIVQINNLSNTYFRFELINGVPKLDASVFVDNIKEPDEKFRTLSPEGELYIEIQRLLKRHFDKVK